MQNHSTSNHKLLNLIKYDLKFIYKQLIVFYIIVLGCAIIARLTSFKTDSFAILIIHEFTQGCAFGFGFGTLVNASIRTWARFRNNMYGDESYLTHTLPVSHFTLWLSKFLSGTLVMLISTALLVAAFFIMFFSSDMIQTWGLEDPIMVRFVIVFIIAVLFQAIFLLQSGFTGTIIGHRFNSSRIARSVLYGFGVYFLGQVFLIGLVLIIGQIDPEVHNMLYGGGYVAETIPNVLLAGTILYAILSLATFFINNQLLKHGVDVD